MKKTWNYTFQLSKRFDWIISFVMLMFITDIIVIIAIIIADINNVYNNLTNNSYVFSIIFAIYLIAAILVVITNKGECHYHYVLDDNELVVYKDPLINISFNHELETNQRIGSHIILKHVKKIELLKDRNEIKICGLLLVTSVYVNPDEIEDIYQTLIELCPNNKNK